VTVAVNAIAGSPARLKERHSFTTLEADAKDAMGVKAKASKSVYFI
jgi:hypothetical protein